MHMESHDTIVYLQKPGNLTERITIVIQAEGDEPHEAHFTMSMKHTSSLGELLDASRWDYVDMQRLSIHGHHVIWDRPLSNDTKFILDAAMLKYVATKKFMLQIRLDCMGQTPCIADGDTVTTVIEIGTATSPSRQQALVSITSRVQSLLSCVHTRAAARIEPDSDSVPIATPFRVLLFARDVDNLPVAYTRAEINVFFGDQKIPLQWSRGSSEYVADVVAGLTEQPGLYDLVVNASNAWSEAGAPTSCDLVRRRITVQPAEGARSLCPQGTYTAKGFDRGRVECRPCHPGLFQPDEVQRSCLSCDSIGNFFQELPGKTLCDACPAGKQRYIGVLSAANKSSCQCKEGALSRRTGSFFCVHWCMGVWALSPGRVRRFPDHLYGCRILQCWRRTRRGPANRLRSRTDNMQNVAFTIFSRIALAAHLPRFSSVLFKCMVLQVCCMLTPLCTRRV